VERFETVRPDVTIELPGALRERIAAQARAAEMGIAEGMDVQDMVTEEDGGVPASSPPGGTIDFLVEFDDRLPTGRAAGKLERYDHLLAGWSVHTTRYGRRLGVPPSVVFVCRDRARARECARRADAMLTACRAYAGEYPADWEYPGRQGVMFVAERDAHVGLLRGYGVPRLPPDVARVRCGRRSAGARGRGRAAGAAWGSLAGRRIIAVTWTMIPTMVSVFAPTLTRETRPKEDFRDPPKGGSRTAAQRRSRSGVGT